MPKAAQITRQNQNGSASPPKTGGSVLDRVSPLRASKIGNLKASFYGPPKTGKTRLACTFPKPLLLVGFEDGTGSVVGTKDVDFVRMEATDEITDLIEGPVAGGKYASVAVDNVTSMREMRIRELFKARGMEVPERKPFLYADKVWKEVWTQCGKDIRDLLGPLFDLVDRMDRLNVVVLAQEQVFGGDEEGGGGAGDAIKPAVGSAVGKTLAIWLSAACDYVCATYIRAQTVDRVLKVAGSDVVNKVQTGKKEYCLRTGPHETYVTGFRVPLGLPDPPDLIINPSYEKIAAVIQGRYKP